MWPCQGVINGTSLEISQLWDIRQLVRTLAEDIVEIRHQETASESGLRRLSVRYTDL
jgi:hypothetical protein